jgi:hypothetical protein
MLFNLEKPARPVTLPSLHCLDKPPAEADETELKAAAAKIAEQHTVRCGLDAWRAINKAETFNGWKAIGAALMVGRDHALKATGANAPMSRRYCKVFNAWIVAHHFTEMPKSVRSVAIDLHENIDAITEWRATLSEKDRRRLVHPLSNVRRWRQATTPKAKSDRARQAETALKCFLSRMAQLSPSEAAPLWETATAAYRAHHVG